MFWVPLIEHLTNGQFNQNMQKLSNAAPEKLGPRAYSLCRCGCGREVSERRKFINQDHYNTWLSRERFFGHNQRH